MRNNKILKTMTALAASLVLFGCTSNGVDSSAGDISGGSSSGGSSGGLANDGSTPTNITNNGVAVSGNFICTQGSLAYGNVTTQVGSNGLVGGLLTTLLNLLGATTVTQLLNSVSNPNNVIDGNLDTYASVSLTLGLLGGLLSSVDESVVLPSGTTVPAGKYAVFGVSFPKGTVDLSLVNQVEVATYLNNSTGVSTLQEGLILNQSALTLLGAIGGSTPAAVWIGVETTKPYDRATISLTPGLLTASVGDAMHVFELCVDGRLQ